MLNNEKITLMTKLSLYEQKNGKKEIKSSKYFKSDYMLLKMVSSFFCITFAYLLSIMDYVQLRQNDIHADNYRKNSSIGYCFSNYLHCSDCGVHDV